MIRRIACVSLAVAALWGGLASAPAFAKPVELTILHTNDTHDHLEAFDDRTAKDMGGVARRATLIRQVKAAKPNTLVLDAGDVFQGTPIFTFFAGEADYKALSQAGYDLGTVGNHDMDNGLANLLKQTQHLNFPLVCANFARKDGQLIFKPYEIVERGGLKIAVIGLMGEGAFDAIADSRRRDVQVFDSRATLRRYVPELRKQADLVVVLSHAGHDEEVGFARDVEGIDLIVGGHSHTKVERPVEVRHGDRTTLVVQAFQWGAFVGHLDLTIDDQRIQSYSGELMPVDSRYAPDPTVAATVAHYASQIEKQMGEVVGRSGFEFVNAKKSESDAPIGNLLADMLRESANADVGVMNSGGIRSGLPQGPITRGMVFSMLPFENYLVTCKVSGAVLQEIMDFAASRIGKQGSVHVSGVKFYAQNGKAVDLRVNGAPIDPKRTYTLATIDYIAAGNDGSGVFTKAASMSNSGELLRDVFVTYLKRHPELKSPEGGRIQVR